MAIFVISGAAIWFAGNSVSRTTDVLSDRLHLGDALGGLVVLAIVTNLPEIAIVVSGAVNGSMSVAVGNILGGIAAQTVVIVALDRFGGGKFPLSFRAASLMLVLEAVLVSLILGLVIAGTQLPKNLIYARMTPIAPIIVAAWIGGVWVIARYGNKLPWANAGTPVDRHSEPRGHRRRSRVTHSKTHEESTRQVALTFAFGAFVTLVAGVALEMASTAIADKVGMSGVLFGATVLAAATALPELSTGLTSVRMGDIEMAVGDILGGNAFLPTLFFVATLISGKSVLSMADKSDIYLTALGIVLTCVYTAGFIFRPQRRVWGMGLDSVIVLVVYVAAIGALPFLP